MLSFKFLKKIRLYTSNKAGQGMIEYTLLLALFVVVGYTFLHQDFMLTLGCNYCKLSIIL